MVMPPSKALMTSAPSAARQRALQRHALRRSAAALVLATLVALALAVLYRAAVSRPPGASWGWETLLPSVVASEEEEGGAEVILSHPSFY